MSRKKVFSGRFRNASAGKLIFLFAAIAVLLSGISCLAAGKTRLSRTKITMSEGQKKNLKLEGGSGQTAWKILSGKKNISIRKSGKRTVVITAKKKGTAKVQAADKGKKYICTVTVKAAQAGGSGQTQASGGQTQADGSGTGSGQTQAGGSGTGGGQTQAGGSGQAGSGGTGNGSSPGQQTSGGNQEKEEAGMRIVISAGRQKFSAVLYDSPAAGALWEKLPLTLDMSEMNGNEKYYFMEEALPVDAGIPDRIHEGDLMLYGTDCLVLFYDSFRTSYRYTPLGRVEDPSGLAQALGNGNVRVTFERADG